MIFPFKVKSNNTSHVIIVKNIILYKYWWSEEIKLSYYGIPIEYLDTTDPTAFTITNFKILKKQKLIKMKIIEIINYAFLVLTMLGCIASTILVSIYYADIIAWLIFLGMWSSFAIICYSEYKKNSI